MKINKIGLNKGIDRYDIVVVKYENSTIIKRVIGKIDFESHYYLDENRFTEIDLDNFYQKSMMHYL